MKIQFIDITTYQGLSSNAEHFYASVGTTKYIQEALLTDLSNKINEGVLFSKGTQLRYYPTADEAEIMWKKDHIGDVDNRALEWHDTEVKAIQKDGTIRFPTITSVIRAARKMFPNTVLCFSFHGSVTEFSKRFVRPCFYVPVAKFQDFFELSKELTELIQENEKNATV